MAARRRLIVDTDPGIDDSMALACAFNSPDVEVIGLTTIFGNVQTEQATKNAFFLLQLAGREETAIVKQIPVAEGAPAPLSGVVKQVADFVHGKDGFGNTYQQIRPGQKHALDAAAFIVDAVNRDPGNVSVLALGPLTNLALAFKLDSRVAQNIKELVILGGAFFVEGNVNPAAEANILGDPEAADYVFGQTDRIRVLGLDVTHKCRISVAQLERLKGSTGRFGAFLWQAIQFYLQYHRDAYGMEAIYAHDPSAYLAFARPELFTWQPGGVRVLCDGFARGKTMQDPGRKRWNTENGWTGRPKVQVAVAADYDAVVDAILDGMCS